MRLFGRKQEAPDSAEDSSEEQEAPRRGFLGLGRGRAEEVDPLAEDEAMEPIAMELAVSRRFTLIVGPVRDPQAKPIDLPALGGRRRGLFGGGRVDPLDDVVALIAATDVSEPAPTPAVRPEPAQPVQSAHPVAAAAEAGRPAAVEAITVVQPPPQTGRWLGLVLVAAAVLGLVINFELIPAELLVWWPLAMAGLGLALAGLGLRAVRRGQNTLLLLGLGLACVSVALLLVREAGFPAQASLGAALLAALGLTILVRAVFVRPQPPSA